MASMVPPAGSSTLRVLCLQRAHHRHRHQHWAWLLWLCANSHAVCSANMVASNTNTSPAWAGCAGTHRPRAAFSPAQGQQPPHRSHILGQREWSLGAGPCLREDRLVAEAEERMVLDPAAREVGRHFSTSTSLSRAITNLSLPCSSSAP